MTISPAHSGKLKVGVDVGGTFTDFVGSDGTTTWLTKVPSTPDDPSRAVVEGLARLCAAADFPIADVATLLHGTTLATNAVLQRRGAKSALITTRGFRDVLSIARQIRPRLFDFDASRAEPLIPRGLRMEVSERIDSFGLVEVPLVVDELAALVETLRAQEVESLAVCFLHAYANPLHERQAREAILDIWPDVPISLSSDVLQEYREYERTSTTAINAYVAPGMARYLSAMGGDLRDRGARCSVRIMQSNGGLMSIDRACRLPATTVLSGVAAGALGGVRLAHAAGRRNVLTLDMGGTSCDLAVGSAGEVLTNRSYEIGGLPIRLPGLDVRTIGAGGGSIAYLDAGGGVHVGPRSAGAAPGPACYGNGGEEPTVTDANLVLGRIPTALLGGEVPLDVDRAIAAIKRFVGDPLKIELEEAAAGIVRVINAAMAREMRVLTVQRGIDPRDFALVAFGGGGPVHAAELAYELGMKEVIVPPSPGVTSAVGLLLADTRYDRVKTVLIELSDSSESAGESAASRLEQAFVELEAEIEKELTRDAEGSNFRHLREVEMRYLRQGHELRVPLPDGAIDLVGLEGTFHQVHKERFGYAMEGESSLVVNALLTLVVDSDDRPIGSYSAGGVTPSVLHTRPVWFDDEWIETRVVPRAALRGGATEVGPLIVEQTDTTVVVPPGASLEVDERDNLVISAAEQPS